MDRAGRSTKGGPQIHGEKERNSENIAVTLQPQQWPDAIKNLNPRYIRVSNDDSNKPQIRLFWGSGFLGTWGFVVGNENLKTPVSDNSWEGEYRREINQGVYVFYEIN